MIDTCVFHVVCVQAPSSQTDEDVGESVVCDTVKSVLTRGTPRGSNVTEPLQKFKRRIHFTNTTERGECGGGMDGNVDIPMISETELQNRLHNNTTIPWLRGICSILSGTLV